MYYANPFKHKESGTSPALVFKSQPCKRSLSDCFELDARLSSIIVWNVFLFLTLDTP